MISIWAVIANHRRLLASNRFRLNIAAFAPFMAHRSNPFMSFFAAEPFPFFFAPPPLCFVFLFIYFRFRLDTFSVWKFVNNSIDEPVSLMSGASEFCVPF